MWKHTPYLIKQNAGQLTMFLCLLIFFALVLSGCTKPFSLTVSTNNINILVVEGMINTGGIDSTIIKLSRTAKVNDPALNPETNAIVTVENSQGNLMTLVETVKGTYASPPLALDNTKQYRLRIKTSSGQTYLSDLIDAKVSPPIDSIGYNLKGTGIQIYANAHDPDNNTHYYKYDYRETWQFNSAYNSGYVFAYKDTDLVFRTPAQQIHDCFGTDSSTHTIVYSTASLSEDVAYQVPITVVDDTLEKLETKYSILVTQQALTKEAFAFYENLRKNTEGLGSIFDAQPSLLIGHIHNPGNLSEPVIGYISAGTKRQKRIYILKSALPSNWQPTYLSGCHIDIAYYYPRHHSLVNKLVPVNFDNPNLPFDYSKHTYWVELAVFPNLNETLYQGRPYGDAIETYQDTVGYTFSTTRCTDCTTRGATIQPAFWK